MLKQSRNSGWWLTLVLLWTAAWWSQPAQAEPQAGLSRFAVVVGSNNGGSGRVTLRYANTDARAFARVLKHLGGVESAQLKLVEGAGRAQMLAAVEALRPQMQQVRASARRVELVLYYSGHSDEQGLLPGGERVSYSELRKLLRDLPVDVRIAILDSCASGALIRAKGGTKRAPFLEDASTQVSGHAYLTSASADEAAQESDQIGASFFTHHLLTGLRGAADTSGDRRVTLSEAYQFAFHKTLARTEATQRGPQHANYDFDLVGSGDVVITDLSALTSALALPAALYGRLLVREPGGALVLELDKVAGHPLELGLEPGTYKLVLLRGNKAWAATVTVQRGGKVVVEPHVFEPIELARHRARGDETPTEAELVEEELAEEPDPATPTGERVKVLWSLAPGLASAPTDVTVSHSAVGLVSNAMGRNEGSAVAVGGNFVHEHNTGVLVAAGLNYVGGRNKGVVVTAGANVVAGRSEGVAVGAGANVLGGGLRGMAFAAGANVLGRSSRGVTFAAGANVTGSFAGLQISAGSNIAQGTVRGVQYSAGFNHATELRGVQLGLVNHTGTLRGVQFGLVNFVDHIKSGDTVGLLTFAGNGYRHLEVWSSDTSLAGVAYKFGGKHFYTVLTAGVGVGDQPATAVGIGWGGHFPIGPVYLDLDTSLLMDVRDIGRERAESLLMMNQSRLLIGLPIGRYFALFTGVTANLAFSDNEQALSTSLIPKQATLDVAGDTKAAFWPGVVFGLRL